MAAGQHIYDIAMDMNERNIHFPLWGSGLGFELMAFLAAKTGEIFSRCQFSNETLLEMEFNYYESKLFSMFPNVLKEHMESHPVPMSDHHNCVSRENIDVMGMKMNWNWTAVAKDHERERLKFATAIEHKLYPFFAIQFHPEKIIFDWSDDLNVKHSILATEVSEYFGAFFVNECRQNNQSFINYSEENRHLIHNFPVKSIDKYKQEYLFKENEDYKTNDGVYLYECSMLILTLAVVSFLL